MVSGPGRVVVAGRAAGRRDMQDQVTALDVAPAAAVADLHQVPCARYHLAHVDFEPAHVVGIAARLRPGHAAAARRAARRAGARLRVPRRPGLLIRVRGDRSSHRRQAALTPSRRLRSRRPASGPWALSRLRYPKSFSWTIISIGTPNLRT